MMQTDRCYDWATHYAEVRRRIKAAVEAANVPVEPDPQPPPPPEPEPDLRPPLLAGAPIGRIRDLVEPVLQRHQLTWKDISGRSRRRPIVMARQECMWVMRSAGMSYPLIGRFLRRDHTTVLHGVRQHERTRLTQG